MKLVRRTIIVVAQMLLCLIILCSCWNRRELNELGILAAVATDIEDGKYKLTFELMRPSKAGGSNGNKEDEGGIYVQSTGESIFDAIRNVTMKFDRRLFLPHCRVFIFSEEMARKGLVNYLDFWNRDHESRRSGYIVVVKGDSAADILGVAPGLEKQTSIYLEDVIENQGSNSKTVRVNVKDFMKAYYSEGIEPIAVGVMQKQRKEQIGSGKEKYDLTAEGSAVFAAGKLIGFLDGNETMGMNFVRNRVKSGIIVAPSPEEKGHASIEILGAKSKNTVQLEDDKLKFDVETSLTGMISEHTGTISLRDPAEIEKLETEVKKVLKQRIESVINKAQKELKSDVFGFEKVFMRKYYYQWDRVKGEKWTEMFTKADVSVTTKVELKRRGMINNPVLRKEVE